eukprot:1248272-Rhodomonas_salina.3
MKEGEDFENSFAQVPHATAGCIIISMAAGMDLELHSCDLKQAFIQADKLDEGINGRIFINPPQGSDEDGDTVYEVLLPLYGIPSSARALHLTLSKWFKEQGFVTVGFEDSVWVLEAGGQYLHCLIVSAHIDDTLMACESKETMAAFKKAFLTLFEGTDEGEVTTYLGCELIRDRVARTIIFRQAVYAKKILQLCKAWDKKLVKTPLQPGTRLSKDRGPCVVSQLSLHHGSSFFSGHHDPLQPGVRVRGAEQIRPAPGSRTPDGCRTRTPISQRNVRGGSGLQRPWHATTQSPGRVGGLGLCVRPGHPQAKRQNCVTLSSAEAEYVAASMCRQEVIYLRALLRGFGAEQVHPTEVWEDNAACIQIANNPVNRKFTRHINVRRYFVLDMVRDGLLLLVKCAGTHNVADALTKSLPSQAFLLHCPFLTGTRQEYKAFFSGIGMRMPEAVAAAAA